LADGLRPDLLGELERSPRFPSRNRGPTSKGRRWEGRGQEMRGWMGREVRGGEGKGEEGKPNECGLATALSPPINGQCTNFILFDVALTACAH